jgi:hypothetical protein
MTTPQVSPRMQKQLATTGARVIEVKHERSGDWGGHVVLCECCCCVCVCACV